MNKKEFAVLCILFLMLMFFSYEIDNPVNLWVQAHRNFGMDVFFKIITNFFFVTTIIVVIPFCYLYFRKRRQEISYFAAYIFAFVINIILKAMIHRTRPNAVIAYGYLDIVDFSFPSAHAMVTFAILPLNFVLFPKLKYHFLVFAILVGLSRIYLGLHYLSDVVAGAFLGLGIGYVIMLAYSGAKNGRKKVRA